MATCRGCGVPVEPGVTNCARCALGLSRATTQSGLRVGAGPGPGDVLGGYRLVEELGRGGMGVVFRAIDGALGRMVAVKIITPPRMNDPALRERFRREARLTAELEHPNVLPVYRAGQDRGQLYLAMRLIEGTDLGVRLSSGGAMEPEEA